MSAGEFVPANYETDVGTIFPVRIQPETLTLTLATVANAEPTGVVAPGLPSAKVSGGNNEIGVICRKVRFRFSTATIPPGYAANSILTLPVLSSATYAAWGKNSVGTYTIGGTAYDVAFVGKSPERIN